MAFIKRCESIFLKCLLCGRPLNKVSKEQLDKCNLCINSFDSYHPKLCGNPMTNFIQDISLCEDCEKLRKKFDKKEI